MHTIRFPLKTTAYDKQMLEKRFRMLWHIHNQLIKEMQRRLHVLERDRISIDAKSQYLIYSKKLANMEATIKKKEKPDKEELKKCAELRKQKNQYAKILNKRRIELNVTKAYLESYVQVMQHRFQKHISSQQAQKEVNRVWDGVEKILFGDGKQLHFKKLADMHSISQKSATNGIKYKKETDTIHWLGLEIPISINWEDEYIKESMGHTIKYIEISKEAFSTGWHWYVTFVLDGPAPQKMVAGEGTCGIDAGVSTMANWSEHEIGLFELAPKCKEYNRKIIKEQRCIDVQTRQSNPQNYNPDGTIRKGKKIWSFSNGCKKRKQKVRALYRKKSAYTKHQHCHDANLLLQGHKHVLVEEMNYKALQKRAKGKAERQDKVSKITQKNGVMKEVQKYKKKKRFGKSLNDRSPALFLQILKQKCLQYGGSYHELNTKELKASQYDHTTGTYQKQPLSKRTKEIGRQTVLRDPYSSFLIRCSEKEKPDQDLCSYFYDRFLYMQDCMILFSKDEPHPASFGY